MRGVAALLGDDKKMSWADRSPSLNGSRWSYSVTSAVDTALQELSPRPPSSRSFTIATEFAKKRDAIRHVVALRRRQKKMSSAPKGLLVIMIKVDHTFAKQTEIRSKSAYQASQHFPAGARPLASGTSPGAEEFWGLGDDKIMGGQHCIP